MYQIGSETMLLEESCAAEGLGLSGPGSAMDQDTTFDNEAVLNALIPLQYRISAATVSKVDEDQQMIQMTFTRKQWDAEGAWTGDFEQIVRERRLESLSKSEFVESKGPRTTPKWRWPSSTFLAQKTPNPPLP